MKPVPISRLTTIASYAVAAVLVLAPFQALLTVSAASILGHYNLVRLWEELVLLGLLPVAVWQVWRQPQLWHQLRRGWLLWAMLCYVLLEVGLGLVALHKGQVNSYALLYAWIVDMRPMVFFLEAYIIAWSVPWLHTHWKRLLLWPAVAVVGFGLLQLTVLPNDFLRHVGYGPATVASFETVDNKPEYARLQSTLRGSNPLGAYMVVVFASLLVLLRRPVWRSSRWLYAGLLASLLVLSFTYSRSAYIGVCVACLAAVVMSVRDRRERRYLAYGLVVLAVVCAGLFTVLRSNEAVENALFHTSRRSLSSTSSNEARASAMEDGLRDVVSEPFGRGPGTAGPASVHNDQPARIAENYYLQIGQEVGWLGLGLFVAIIIMIGGQLWRHRADPLARLLLISLAGVSFINLVQHAWTDDTLTFVWWGFAGIALAGVAVREKTSRATAK